MQFSKQTLEFIKKECERYETRRSAIIPCLYKIQEEMGYINVDAVKALAQVMDIPESKINEVLKFYTMFNQNPVGKLHVQVCNNISCCMMGSRELTQHLLNTYKVDFDEITPDGKFSFSSVECLGSCDTAPMMQVNDKYYENLTQAKIDQLIEEWRAAK